MSDNNFERIIPTMNGEYSMDIKSDLPFKECEVPDYKILNNMYARIKNLERENDILVKYYDELHDDVRRVQLDIALLFVILGVVVIFGLLFAF